MLTICLRQATRRSGPPESRRTLSRRNHFSSFLPGETGAQGARRSGSPGCTVLFFEGTSFPHSFRLGPQPWEAKRSDSPGCTALFFKGTTFPHSFRLGPQPWEAKRSDSPDAPHFFSREPLFLIPSGWDRKPWKPGDRARRDTLHFVSREPLFLIPFVSRTQLAAPDFLQQFFL